MNDHSPQPQEKRWPCAALASFRSTAWRGAPQWAAVPPHSGRSPLKADTKTMVLFVSSLISPPHSGRSPLKLKAHRKTMVLFQVWSVHHIVVNHLWNFKPTEKQVLFVSSLISPPHSSGSPLTLNAHRKTSFVCYIVAGHHWKLRENNTFVSSLISPPLKLKAHKKTIFVSSLIHHTAVGHLWNLKPTEKQSFVSSLISPPQCSRSPLKADKKTHNGFI